MAFARVLVGYRTEWGAAVSGRDVFRPQYRDLSEEETKLIGDIKDKAGELYDLINKAQLAGGGTREMALAKTNLEQSVMWAVKAVTG